MDEQFVRSNSELCRYLINADPSRFPIDRLERELNHENMLARLRLNVRFYSSDAAAPAPGSTELTTTPAQNHQIQTASEMLKLSYSTTFSIVRQFLKIHFNAELNLESILEFYLHERVQLLILLSLLLQAAGDAHHPYCSVGRSIIPKLDNLFDNIIQSYRELSEASVPKQLTYDKGMDWADNTAEEQAVLLQVILTYFFAFKDSPTRENATTLVQLCKDTDFGVRPVIFTLLSKKGRAALQCIAALWTQIFNKMMQFPVLVRSIRSGQYPSQLILGPVSSQLDLDRSLFQHLGGRLEHGPVLLSFATYLCLSYQSLEAADQDPEVVMELQNRVVAHLSTAISLKPFETMRMFVRALDEDCNMSAAALLARQSYHVIVSSLCRSNVFNLLYNLPGFLDNSLHSLYERLLDKNPILSEELWTEIEDHAHSGDDFRSFPVFAYEYSKFCAALSAPSIVDYDYNAISSFLSLLRVLSNTPVGASRSAAILEQICAPQGGRVHLQKTLFEVVRSTVQSGIAPPPDKFRFILALIRLDEQCGRETIDSFIGVNYMDAIMVLLNFISEQNFDLQADDAASAIELTEAATGLLGLIHFTSDFSSRLVQYNFWNLASRLLYRVDIRTGNFRCTIAMIKFVKRMILKSQIDVHFPVESFLPIGLKLIEFLINHVFLKLLSWRYADPLIKWELCELMLSLMFTVLSSDDLIKPTTLVGKIGSIMAVRCCTETPIIREILHPITSGRPILQFNTPKRTKDVVSRVVNSAFRVLELILRIRFDWHHQKNVDADLSDHLFDVFFCSGIDSSQLLRIIQSYMDVGERHWQRHAVVILTLVGQLSAVTSKQPSSFAGFLGESKVSELCLQCCRLLESSLVFFQEVVLSLCSSALQYQPGLAERLFAYSAGTHTFQDQSIWFPIRALLRESTDVVIIRQVLEVIMHLWEAAAIFKTVALIVDLIVVEPSFWKDLTKYLSADVTDSEPNRAACEKILAQSHVFHIITCELRYNDQQSTSLASSKVIDQVLKGPGPKQWQSSFLLTAEQWASLDERSSAIYMDAILNWRLFVQSCLLVDGVEKNTIVNHIKVISNIAQEGLPLSVASDLSSLLLSLLHHVVAPIPAEIFPLIVRSLCIHQAAFISYRKLAVVTRSTILRLSTTSAFKIDMQSDPTLEKFHQIVDSLLTAACRLIITGVLYSEPDLTLCFRMTCQLLRDVPDCRFDRHLLVLLDCIRPGNYDSLHAITECGHLSQSCLTTILDMINDAADLNRTYSVLRCLCRLAVFNHGASMLVVGGLLPRLSNSFLRDERTRDIRQNQVWIAVLDVVLAMIIATPATAANNQQFGKQLSEFLAVFRRNIESSLEASSAATDGSRFIEVDRTCCVLYEIGRSSYQHRVVPKEIQSSFSHLVRQTAVNICSILTDPHSSISESVLLPPLCSSLSYLRLLVPSSVSVASQEPFFQIDLGYRQHRSAAPSIMFTANLIDFLTNRMKSTDSSCERFLPTYRFILEHSLFLLVSYFLCGLIRSDSQPMIQSNPQEYIEVFSRIINSIESDQVASTSSWAQNSMEVILDPLRHIEQTLQTLSRSKPSSSSSTPTTTSHYWASVALG